MKSNNFFKSKYIKYKNKYLNLRQNNDIMDENKNLISIKAVAFFNGDKINGTVYFIETNDDKVIVKINLEGFEPNSTHGFHVHESGDLTTGCDSMCAHFNPFNQEHGGQNDEIRHVGDLGNLYADYEGKIIMEFSDHMIKLRGDIANIIGRGLIIHQDPDDYGKGNHEDSKTTGHSGKRIACAIIGYASVK